jgi:hypothetical protein
MSVATQRVAAGAAGSQTARKAAVWTPRAARHFHAFKAELEAAPEALRRVADWPEPSSANEVDAFMDAAAKYAPVIGQYAADSLAALEWVSTAGFGGAWEPEGKAQVWRPDVHGAAFDALKVIPDPFTLNPKTPSLQTLNSNP